MVDGKQQGENYPNMKGALAAANNVNLENEVTLVCEAEKPINFVDAHISLTRSMTIEGNNAYAYMGNQQKSGDFAIDFQDGLLKADTELVIKNFHNVSVWGGRATSYEFSLQMDGCKLGTNNYTGARVLLRGDTGENVGSTNIELKNCTFGSGVNESTAVHTTYNGVVQITDCSFERISEPVNINAKLGSSNIKVKIKNTTFTDCGEPDDEKSNAAYAAPIRIVSSGSENVKADVTISGCSFSNPSSVNGDILIGDGRISKDSNDVNVNISGLENDVNIQWQVPGYQDNKSANANKATIINASKNASISAVGKDITLESGSFAAPKDGLNVMDGMTINVKGTLTGPVEGDGSLVVKNGGDVSGVTTTGNVTIDDQSDDSSKKTITWKDGEVDYYADGSQHIIRSNQIIKIEGEVILVSESQLSIAGKLVIPAGAELIVESGAVLEFVNGGSIVVEGTLKIEGADEDVVGSVAGALVLDVQSKADISGNLTVNGSFQVSGKSEVVFEQDSSVLIATGGVMTVADGKVLVDDSAVLTVNGLVETATKVSIQNEGTVVVDSADVATNGLTVSNIANGAVVDIVKFTGNGTAAIIVNDDGLVFTTYREDKKDVQVTGNKDNTTVTVTPGMDKGVTDYVASVSGVKIVSVTSSANKKTTDTGGAEAGIDKNGKKWSKSMDISGNVSAAYAEVEKEESDASATDITTPTVTPKAEAGIEFDADSKGFAVAGELALGANITLSITEGTVVAVTGTVTAVASSTIVNSGSIKVTGEGEVSNVAEEVAKTVSTMHVTSAKDSSGNETKTYHYVNIDKALVVVNSAGSEVKNLTLQDAQIVKVSASLPADVVLDINGKTLTIDSKDNVTLEVVKGASVKGATGSAIAVDGTLYAQDKSNVKIASDSIESDIYSEELGTDGKAVKNGWAKWTNLSSALADAKPGEKITLNKVVELENNTTVPEGVTLEAGDYNIKLADGVTLTVNGILITDADILAQSAFATEAKKVSVEGSEAYSSAVIVNGKLISSKAIAYVYGEPATESGDDDFTDAVELTKNSVVAGAYYTDKDGNHIISSMQIAQDEFAAIDRIITVNGAVTAGDLAFTATEDCTAIVIGTNASKIVDGEKKNIDTILTVSSLALSGMTLTVDGKITGTVVVGDAAVDMKKASGISIDSDDSKLRA